MHSLRISKCWVPCAAEEVEVDGIDRRIHLAVQLFENVVEVLELVLDSLLVVHGRSGGCLRALSCETTLAFARARLEVHHCLEHIDLLSGHAATACSCRAWPLHYLGFRPVKSMRSRGRLLLFTTGFNEGS